MTKAMAAQSGGRIIRITPTGRTWLVTVEVASTGRIAEHLTRAWATAAEARTMARNAYRTYATQYDLAA